jgi:hypothetical protein
MESYYSKRLLRHIGRSQCLRWCYQRCFNVTHDTDTNTNSPITDLSGQRRRNASAYPARHSHQLRQIPLGRKGRHVRPDHQLPEDYHYRLREMESHSEQRLYRHVGGGPGVR